MVTVGAMLLDDWIIREGLTSAEFGKLSGIGNKQLVHRYRHGERFPSPQNLLRIRQATRGKVTADDFVNQHTASPTPPRARPRRRSRVPRISAAVAD